MTRHLKIGRAHRDGFTLIELLVVISLIALLIGLLLPALAQSRRSARTATCLSRLRQHGVAFNLYVLDYDALPHEDDSQHPEIICWYYAINEFLGVVDESENGFYEELVPDVKVCPEVIRKAPAFIKGFRFNSGLESNKEPFFQPEKARFSDRTVILFDAEYGGTGISFKGRKGKVDYRHPGGTNVLFADWHAEIVPKSDVDTLVWRLNDT